MVLYLLVAPVVCGLLKDGMSPNPADIFQTVRMPTHLRYTHFRSEHI